MTVLRFAVLALLGVAILIPEAKARVMCGDTITRYAVLTSDLICPFEDPVLTIDGGFLNMRGFAVDCDGESHTGIVMKGTRSKLFNGTVTGCEKGVVIAGTGRHYIRKMKSIENSDDGFEIKEESNKNLLMWSHSVRNEEVGFDVNGDRNRLFKNSSKFNTLGIDLDGNRNSAALNRVIRNRGGGIEVDGDENRVILNAVLKNDDEGIHLDVGSDGNKVYRNRVRTSLAAGGTTGIDVEEGSEGNTISRNNVDVTDTGFNDLIDANPKCDNNVWSNNTFVTAFPSCVK